MESSLKRVDWGHVAFVVFIAGSVSWYFYDAYSASSSIKNLILIGPASALALILCAALLIQDIQKALRVRSEFPRSAPATPVQDIEKPATVKEDTAEKRRGTQRVIVYILAFGLYIGLLEIIGYDVATWLFIAASLVWSGERRPWVVVVFSVAFGSLAVWLFGLLLPYPMLTLVVPN